ncbi:MAG: hypothetical protein HYR66_02975 [Sphingobacteriales bacterium]|nr:hypothetical protein [Sphingobacteriales bacterium]
MKQVKNKLLMAATAIVLLSSCQKEQNLKNETFETSIASSSAVQKSKYNTFNGDEIIVGNGYAHTFVTQSHTGVPKELGIVFTDEALSGLPTTNAPYVLDFHPKALESPAGFMPANYIADAAIPQLGVHWAPNNFTSGSTINHTLILGSYNGSFTFVSPIVTRTTLASGVSVSLPYAQPQYFAQHGYYPTKYNIYEDDKNRHYVTLSDFVWR